MRVLLYADVDLSRPGGVETHVRELALGLLARGHTVDLFAQPAPVPPLTVVERFDPDRYDVLHHHAGAWPRALDVGDRYVRTFHFCVAAKMDAYVRLGRYRTLLNRANWRARAAERADVFRSGRAIAVSRRLRDELARQHGLDAGRTAVLPNGVSFAPPRFGREEWRERNRIPDEARVLLTIGRHDFVKGYDLLERAWREVRARVADPLWILVGGSAPWISGDRRVTGPVPHEEVREWIAAADVGAFPSYYEGGGLALLEMLAGGLYTASHNVGGAVEALEAGGGGEIVPAEPGAWADALVRLLPEPPRSHAPLLPSHYRWDAVAAAVEAVYRGR